MVNVLSVHNSQKEIYFHENEHDGRHKYDEMLNQESDNQDEMSYTLRTYIERNENTLMSMIRTQKGKTRTPKNTQKIIIKSTTKQTLKRRFILENESRHAINKIDR